MYTIVVDEEDRKRQTENRINAVFRHCRIGKVSTKPPKHWTRSKLLDGLKGKPIYPSFPLQNPDDGFTFRWPSIYADQGVPAMCRQCIGKACGNAACPARPVVTC